MPPSSLPCLYIAHGGGPCFFMPDDGSMFPPNTWTKMGAYLRNLGKQQQNSSGSQGLGLAQKPKAVLVVSAHWETRGEPTVNASPSPPLLYDYYGFPEHTYNLRWPRRGPPR